MTAPIYTVKTEGAVALVGATAKTVLTAVAHANSGLQLLSVKLGFDGVTASAVPVLVELCYCTFGTAGTGTSVTPTQTSGRVLAAGFTGLRNYSAEPTTMTVLEEWLISPNSSTALMDIPLGNEYDTALAQGFALRITAPAAVNCRATMAVTRI